MKLNKEQMVKILKDKAIDNCNEDEVKQVMNFLFGEEFMKSKDKGEIKTFDNS
tara:strand:+ start:1548 stop:1706 length:159 start_codon:yes stop_codon:yes gene_type:complete